MSASILALPAELLQDVARKLSSTDKNSFWASCTHVKNATEKENFSSLKFNIGKNRAEHSISLIEALANNDTLSTQHTKSLEIDTLALSFQTTDAVFHREGVIAMFQGLNAERVEVREDYSDPRLKDCKTKMVNMLSPAIRALQDVRSVRWNICDKDPSWAVDAVAHTLGDLPKLSTLSLVIPFGHNSLPLDGIHGLSSLTVSIDGGQYALNQIKPLVNQSPNLRTVCVYSLAGMFNVDSAPKLDNLFAESQPLSLTRVCIQGCNISKGMLPHFQNLTRLDLLGWTHLGDGGFWEGLLQANAFLEDMVLTSLDTQTLDYIASYSGLKRFRLVLVKSVSNVDELARRLLQVLQGHRETLEGLSLAPEESCMLCATRETIPLLEEFTNLCMLSVKVNKGDVKADVHKLLKMAIKLPYLRSLTICSIRTAEDPMFSTQLNTYDGNEVITCRRTVGSTQVLIRRALETMVLESGMFEHLTVCVDMRYTFVAAWERQNEQGENVMLVPVETPKKKKRVMEKVKRLLHRIFKRRRRPLWNRLADRTMNIVFETVVDEGEEEEEGDDDDRKWRFRLSKDGARDTDVNMKYSVKYF